MAGTPVENRTSTDGLEYEDSSATHAAWVELVPASKRATGVLVANVQEAALVRLRVRMGALGEGCILQPPCAGADPGPSNVFLEGNGSVQYKRLDTSGTAKVWAHEA